MFFMCFLPCYFSGGPDQSDDDAHVRWGGSLGAGVRGELGPRSHLTGHTLLVPAPATRATLQVTVTTGGNRPVPNHGNRIYFSVSFNLMHS